MRTSLLLIVFLPLFSCDRETSRKLGQKVGELSYESTRNAEEFVKGSIETGRQKRQEEFGAPSNAPQGSNSKVQDALKRLDEQRRLQDKGFSGHRGTDANPHSYQGFPGHQK